MKVTRMCAVMVLICLLVGVCLAQGKDIKELMGEAIAAQGLLEDVSLQAARSAYYASKAGCAEDVSAELAGLKKAVDSLAVKLGSGKNPPQLDRSNLDAIRTEQSRVMQKARTMLKAAREALALKFPWFQPVVHEHAGATALTEDFVLCPRISRAPKTYKPFGFPASCPAPISPSKLNPAEGTYEFAGLETVVAANAAAGMKTGVSIQLSPKGWWVEKKLGDELFLLGPDGKPGRDTINIWSEEVRRLLKELLTKLGNHFKDNPNIAYYELCNEPLIIGSAEKDKIVPAGYSKSARQAWREYLSRRYQSVEELNSLCRTEYAGWDDVAPPDSLVPSHGQLRTGVLREFQNFRLESHTEFFGELLSALKAADPNHPVLPRLGGMFHDELGATDLYGMAGLAWDVFSLHGDDDAGAPVNYAYAYSINSFAQHKPLWNDEFTWASAGREDVAEGQSAAEIRRNMWRQIAWGKRGFVISGSSDPLMDRRVKGEAVRYCAGAFPPFERGFRQVRDVVLGSELESDGIAVLQPSSSCDVACPAGITESEARRLYSLLWTKGYTALFLPEEVILLKPKELEKFKVLCAPYATHVPMELNGILFDWIKAGGTLVCSGPFGLYDPYGNPDGALLWDVFNIGNVIPLSAGPEWVAELDAQFMAQTVASDANGRPLVFKTRFGAGIVYLSLSPISYKTELLPDLLKSAAPTPNARCNARVIDLVVRRNNSGDIVLFAVNISTAKAIEDIIAVQGEYRQVIDIGVEQGCPVPVEVSEGATRIPVSLGPGEGTVFLLTKEQSGKREPFPEIPLLTPLLDMGREILNPQRR